MASAMNAVRWLLLGTAVGLACISCGKDFSSKASPKGHDGGSSGGASSGGKAGASAASGTSGAGGGGASSGADGLSCGNTVCDPLPPGCSAARRCCTPDLACGITPAGGGGTCVADHQQGGPDDTCSGGVLGTMGLRGCCRPDETCGGLDDVCGAGCVSASDLGTSSKSCKHDPAMDCFVDGVNRCIRDAGADSSVPPPDGSTPPTRPDGGFVVGATYRFGATQVLAPLVGRLATPATGQENIGVYGTDLGLPVVVGKNLRLLFGDTWKDGNGGLVGPGSDDSQGDISLTTFPTGDSVEAYVTAHPPKTGEVSFQREGPPVTFALGSSGKFAPLLVYRDGTQLDMGTFKTPVTAFANAQGVVFATFSRIAIQRCTNGTTCPGSLTCDTGMGVCAGTTGERAIPCVLGGTTCGILSCVAATGGGICQDRTSSVYNTTEDGRILSSGLIMEVGNVSSSAPTRYDTQAWVTNKFYNPTMITVRDFSPTRVNGTGDDYRVADTSDPARSKVFVWGRPGYAGPRGKGRDVRLYFAYVDMPAYEASGHFAWAPQYYTGTVDGKPQFSKNQTEAVALDLSGGAGDATEAYDIPNQFSIAWIDSLKQWVMLYGGDLSQAVLDVLLGSGKSDIVRDPEGAIHARFADHPWGPWSPPSTVIKGGNPNVVPPGVGTQYASGGILHHPQCNSDCAPSDAVSEGEYGRLYGASIINAWTTPRKDGADIYWAVSTLNPYEVVLMKSRILH
jgi:hypothetical protein